MKAQRLMLNVEGKIWRRRCYYRPKLKIACKNLYLGVNYMTNVGKFIWVYYSNSFSFVPVPLPFC